MDTPLIYLDTNIYMDYFLLREDRLRPLSDFAFELLHKTMECTYRIAISDWVLFELEKNNIPIEKINELLQDLKDLGKLAVVARNEEDVRKAKKYAHWQDTLHAILARKCESKYLVTRNITDYPKDLIEVKFPENL